MYSIKLACLRTTEPLFRTYEPSDHRTFGTENCRRRTYEPSDSRTFGMKNLLLALRLELVIAYQVAGDYTGS